MAIQNIKIIGRIISLLKIFKLKNVKSVLKKLFPFITPNNNINKIYAKLAHLGLIGLICVTILKFNYQPNMHQNQQAKLELFENNLLHLKRIAQVDWQRCYHIKKTITIIDQFNPKMKSQLKLRIAEEIYEMSYKYGNLDVELICATITHETAHSWNPNIVSPAEAIGLMQILPITGAFLAKEEGIPYYKIETILHDPILNIRLGCRYLSSLVKAYQIDGGLAAYNGGERRAERWVKNGRAEGILHEETAIYVPSILKIYEEYREMSI